VHPDLEPFFFFFAKRMGRQNQNLTSFGEHHVPMLLQPDGRASDVIRAAAKENCSMAKLVRVRRRCAWAP